MLPNGGKIESATMSDYLMHFLTFGLKVLFSSCPPPGMMQGWPSFAVSLIYIGFMAALIRFTITCTLKAIGSAICLQSF